MCGADTQRSPRPPATQGTDAAAGGGFLPCVLGSVPARSRLPISCSWRSRYAQTAKWVSQGFGCGCTLSLTSPDSIHTHTNQNQNQKQTSVFHLLHEVTCAFWRHTRSSRVLSEMQCGVCVCLSFTRWCLSVLTCDVGRSWEQARSRHSINISIININTQKSHCSS